MDRFGDDRRTEISFADGEISVEDMIADEEVIITISQLGYIKRTKASEYRIQGRGGRGSKGSKTRDTDFIEHIFVATTHNYLLLFTEQGRCHWLRVYEIPEAGKTSSGRVIQNIINLPKDDKVKAYIKIENLTDEEYCKNNFIIFCTKKGVIKKTLVEAFSRPRTNGINAITIREGDQLLEAKLTNGQNDILMAKRSGRAIRFPESKVRPMGRSAAGVRGVTLSDKIENDEVVGMISVDPNDESVGILVLSERGMGKRSSLEDYRQTNRGGKGVKTMNITDKTGLLIAIKAVMENDDLVISNRSGIVIRMMVSDMRVMGRATQGVKLIRLDDKDSIADIAVIPYSEEDEKSEEEGAVVNEDSPEIEKKAASEGEEE